MKIYRGVINADIEADQRVRNDYRLAKAKAAMGSKYLLHPDNHVQRVEPRVQSIRLSMWGKVCDFFEKAASRKA
jgi:hypothetical protein